MPWTFENAEERYRQNTAPGAVSFTIYERATSRPIGTTLLYDVDHRDRTSCSGILIGEKDCWGRG